MNSFLRAQPASDSSFEKSLGSASFWEETRRMVSEAQQPRHDPDKQSVSRIASKIARLTSVASVYADLLPASSPASTVVVLGSVKLLMQVEVDSSEEMQITEMLEEMADAAETCGREYALYEDPKIHKLLVSIYRTLFSIARLCTKYIRSNKPLIADMLESERFHGELNELKSKMRKSTSVILREVEYHHRLEMRNSSRQLIEASAEHQKQFVEVKVEQRKILNAVEEQREILECLREERTILKVVHEQQKILQAVQQIELRLREAEGVSCSPVMVVS